MPQAPEGIPPAEAAEVGRYIGQNDTKAAVVKAKAIHRRLGTSASEAFLVETYAARVRALLSAGLTAEADALADLVERRYACGERKLEDVRRALAGSRDSPEALLAEWGRAELPSARRRQIARAIRREVTDLSGLARSEALPADDPLRRAADALWRAFEAVTSGPVEPERLALPEVSHRSPLADWKLLVRAIACFYGREDEACRRLLEAIDGESAAARLVGPMRAMLDGGSRADLRGKGAELVAAVEGADRPLREALADLESAFQREDVRRLHGRIRRAVNQCRKARPKLLERLKQLISMRCVAVEYPVAKVISALGGPSLHDAAFWRLFARTLELSGKFCLACALWEEFRRNAVHQGWFGADGPEVTALSLHMVHLLQRMPQELLVVERRHFERHFAGFGRYYEGQPASVRAAAPDPRQPPDCYYLYPERIFERLCAAQADAEVYAQWLDYARSDRYGSSRLDGIAERWHRAVPGDSRPLLFLMESAERRKAFTKALKYLRQAEALDALSPQVKRARLRLWAAKAVRHLREGKPHLAEKDFAAIEALPQSREGDRPMIVAALRWVAARLAGDEAAAARWRVELAGLAGGDEAAVALLTCVGRIATKGAPLVPDGRLPRAGEQLVQAVGRSCAACRDLGLQAEVPSSLWQPLEEAVASDAGSCDAGLLRALAEAALEKGALRLAFAAAGAGLRAGGAHRGRFLLLRGRSLRAFPARRQSCLAVAAELARRRRDTELLAEVIDEAHGGRGHWGEPDFDIEDQAVNEVLAYETADARFPDYTAGCGGAPPWPPAGGRRRVPALGPQAGLFDDLLGDEEDDFADEDFEDSEFGDFEDECDEDEVFDAGPFGGPPLPPEVLDLMIELLRRGSGRLPSAKELSRLARADPALRAQLERVLGSAPPGIFEPVPSQRRQGRKDRRRKRKRERKNRRR